LAGYSAGVKYKVILIESDEGFAVGCPALPGCWSQGLTRDEALTNIQEAIRLWLEVAEEDALQAAHGEKATTAEVVV
jgi:predicted RNase H-like HicB family nuclease